MHIYIGKPKNAIYSTVLAASSGAVCSMPSAMRAARGGRVVLIGSDTVGRRPGASPTTVAGVRAWARGGRLLLRESVVLVALGVLGLALCGLDFVTGERANRAFTVLFAAGGVVGTYARSARPEAAPGEVGT